MTEGSVQLYIRYVVYSVLLLSKEGNVLTGMLNIFTHCSSSENTAYPSHDYSGSD